MFKKNLRKFFIIPFVLILLIGGLSSDVVLAAKKKQTKKKKNTLTTEQQIKIRKEERIQKLYEYFPIYEEWERSEVYPYSDLSFLADYDSRSVFESFYNRKTLLACINDWLGVRYRMPGRSRNGIDCSNFVSQILSESINLKIPAGAATQATLFTKIEKLQDLQFGDLIFFSGRNRNSKRIGHVGIFIGNGLFAHSSTSKGVIYSHISEGYYNTRYRWGGRIVRYEYS